MAATRKLLINPPRDEIFDPLGPMAAKFDDEPDGAEVLVDYEDNRQYIGTADFIIYVVSTGEVVERIPAAELHNLTEAGMQRRITQAWNNARETKSKFLEQLQKEQAEEGE